MSAIRSPRRSPLQSSPRACGCVGIARRPRAWVLELLCGVGKVAWNGRTDSPSNRPRHVACDRPASVRRLGEELEEADEEDNLPLARLRDLVPELGRRLGGVVARDVDGQLDAVGVEACGLSQNSRSVLGQCHCPLSFTPSTRRRLDGVAMPVCVEIKFYERARTASSTSSPADEKYEELSVAACHLIDFHTV